MAHPSIQGDPAFEIILQHVLSLEDEEGSDSSLGQIEGGQGHFLHDHPVKGLGPPQEEPEGTHPFQDLADLRLEDDDDDDQDDGPEVLEDPAGDEEPGPAGQGVKDPEGQEGDQDSQGTGPLNPYVEPVEDKGDQEDIDDIQPADTEEGFFQILNLRTSRKSF
jgi:hypothetical protein